MIGLIALVALWLTVDERSRWLFLDRNGELTTGCAMGVCVGDSRVEALRELSDRGLTDVLEVEGGSYRARNIAVGRTLISVRDHSWQNGVISLEIANQRVIEIRWSYVGPFYVDL